MAITRHALLCEFAPFSRLKDDNGLYLLSNVAPISQFLCGMHRDGFSRREGTVNVGKAVTCQTFVSAFNFVQRSVNLFCNGYSNSQQEHSRSSLTHGFPKSGTLRSNSCIASASKTEGSSSPIMTGALIEFEKDNNRTNLAVVQKPDGKKNWITIDQTGKSCSIKPQQVVFIVPNAKDFVPENISSFLQQVEEIKDDSLLELVWSEAVEDGSTINPIDLSELVYGGSSSVEAYAAHMMLYNDKLYFKKRKGSIGTYEPRTAEQVAELQARLAAEAAVQAEIQHFADSVRRALPDRSKQQSAGTGIPGWREDPLLQERLSAIWDYALEKANVNTRVAEESLEALGVSKLPSSAVDLLFKTRIFPKHMNIELLKSGIPLEYSAEAIAECERVLKGLPSDRDEALRVDLSHLQVYTIDSADTVEIDDGLSIEPAEGGGYKVWVHVADPTRFITAGGALDREARLRGSTVYLCTGSVPMFPLDLAAGPMSLRLNHKCCAVSVGMLLDQHGGLDSIEVVNSYVVPSARMTYEEVDALLGSCSLDSRQGEELCVMARLAELRRQWRAGNGSIEILMPHANVKVSDAEAEEPDIKVSVSDPSSPATRLVSEFMVMCGEAMGQFGAHHSLPLPYRSQTAPSQSSLEGLADIPEGPCRAVALRRCMTKSCTMCDQPAPHAALGLPHYVQFTSPIRRYGDLIAHFQVKALLRGEELPWTAEAMDAVMLRLGESGRDLRKQEQLSTKYWLLEYTRRARLTTVFNALVLKWIHPDKLLVGILIQELGYEATLQVTTAVDVGSVIEVVVVNADPRKGIFELQEAYLFDLGAKPSPSAVLNECLEDSESVERSRIPSSKTDDGSVVVDVEIEAQGFEDVE